MVFLSRWTDGRRALLQTGLLAFCCLVALAIHSLIAADTLGNAGDLALNTGGLLFFVVASGISVLATRTAQGDAARVALWMVSASLMVLTAAFARWSYPAVSIELADLIAPAQAAERQTSIVVGPTGRDVRLSGGIRDGAGDQLSAILETHPAVTRIHLTSEGGLAEEGQALGEVIAAHHLTTFVPDFCLSACTLAFVGGRERLLMDGARLGFHAPYEQGILGQTFAGDAKEQRAAYLAAGVSGDFVDKALKVAPDDMWFPDADRLIAAHVATGTVDRYRFPDSILDGAADMRGARAAVLDNFPALQGFAGRSPSVVDRIGIWYLEAYRQGFSEGENTDGLKTIVRSALTLALAQADDATLLDLARFIDKGMELTAAHEPNRCAAIGSHADLLAAQVELQHLGMEGGKAASVLVARALATGRGLTAATAAAAPAKIVLEGPSDACQAMRQIYAEAIHQRDSSPIRLLLTIAMRGAGGNLGALLADRR